MVVPDDAVLIQKGANRDDPYTVTVNCPIEISLCCDVCRSILEFGLHFTKADISTDGKWCYIVLRVVPPSGSRVVRWSGLKDRLLSVCPSSSISFYLDHTSACPTSLVYLLKFFCLDRKGLLHDVTHVLCELELIIQRVKVMTTPDGRVFDLFFITDNTGLLHTVSRRDEVCEQLCTVLGESCISCELQLAGSEYEILHEISSLSPDLAEELFRCDLSDRDIRSQALSHDVAKLKRANVTVDNSLSPAHTLIKIHCIGHKGLLYDILRTLKDFNIKISYGRFSPDVNGYRDLDLFIQQKDGKKILDIEMQSVLCLRLKVEMLHPLRVIIEKRGPDVELFVANPVEMSGNGRPRVFYDVTLALKKLGICIFLAEIGRHHSRPDQEWEVYRFLLEENREFQMSSMVVRNQIVDRVRRTLMGW